MQQMNFYCRSYCLLNMFRAPLCPSSGARVLYKWFLPAARKPDTQPSAPHYTDNLKTTYHPHIIDDARSKPHQIISRVCVNGISPIFSGCYEGPVYSLHKILKYTLLYICEVNLNQCYLMLSNLEIKLLKNCT
jgi:hypothetical protein